MYNDIIDTVSAYQLDTGDIIWDYENDEQVEIVDKEDDGGPFVYLTFDTGHELKVLAWADFDLYGSESVEI